VTHQEGEEEADGGQEVPDVMAIIELQQHACLVVLPGSRWRQLQGNNNIQKLLYVP